MGIVGPEGAICAAEHAFTNILVCVMARGTVGAGPIEGLFGAIVDAGDSKGCEIEGYSGKH